MEIEESVQDFLNKEICQDFGGSTAVHPISPNPISPNPT